MLELITPFFRFSSVKTGEHSAQTRYKYIDSKIVTSEYSNSNIPNRVSRETYLHAKNYSLQELDKELKKIFFRRKQFSDIHVNVCKKESLKVNSSLQQPEKSITKIYGDSNESSDTHEIARQKELLVANPNLHQPENSINRIHEYRKKLPNTSPARKGAVLFSKMKNEKKLEKIVEESELAAFLEESIEYHSKNKGVVERIKRHEAFSRYLQENIDKIKTYSEIIRENYRWIQQESKKISFKRTLIDSKISHLKNEPPTTHEFSMKYELKKLLENTDEYLDTSKTTLTQYFNFISQEKNFLDLIIEDVRKFESSGIGLSHDFDPKPYLRTILIDMDKILKEIKILLEKICEEKVFIACTKEIFFYNSINNL